MNKTTVTRDRVLNRVWILRQLLRPQISKDRVQLRVRIGTEHAGVLPTAADGDVYGGRVQGALDRRSRGQVIKRHRLGAAG